MKLGALIAATALIAGCAATAPAPRQAIDLQAHRGGRALMPENTLAAFSNAIGLGVTTLELDIGLTADDVVVINRGRLITAGALAQLQQAGISVRTPSPEPLTRILQAAGGVVDARGNGALLVRGLSTAEIGNHACAAGIALHELAARSGSLEELFLSWTGNETPAGLSETGKEKEVVGQ